MIPNIFSYLKMFNEQYGVSVIISDFIINLLIGLALVFVIFIFLKIIGKEHWFFKSRKIEKGKNITVKNGHLSLEVKLTCRIEHDKNVSHFVSISAKNSGKKSINNVKVSVSSTGENIFIINESFANTLNPEEKSESISSDAVHMDRKTGNMNTYLTEVSDVNLISFSCETSYENQRLEHYIFCIKAEEDIYKKMEMYLYKLSRN